MIELILEGSDGGIKSYSTDQDQVMDILPPQNGCIPVHFTNGTISYFPMHKVESLEIRDE